MTPIQWLWLYRFAAGEMALLAGDGGLGKSSLLLAIAAIITRGSEWPDKSGRAPIGSVIIVSAEDSRETTLKPRLVALGADLAHIYFVTARVKMPPRPGEDSVINVQQSLQDRGYLEGGVLAIPDLKMMIIDPIPSYLGRGVNDAKNSELRSVLEPFLDDVTRPAGVALVANTHLNKNVDSSTPVHRITGNTAYGNLPRNVHFVIRDRDDPNRRLFKQAKCNNAPNDLSALAFSIEKMMVPSAAGLDIETSYPVFEAEPVHVDLQEAMGKKGHGHRGPRPRRPSKSRHGSSTTSGRKADRSGSGTSSRPPGPRGTSASSRTRRDDCDGPAGGHFTRPRSGCPSCPNPIGGGPSRRIRTRMGARFGERSA